VGRHWIPGTSLLDREHETFISSTEPDASYDGECAVEANVCPRAARGDDAFAERFCIREDRLMSSFMPYLLVGIGGFLGANARYVVARLVGTYVDTRFPLGTFVINISGSFLLGALGTILAQKVSPNSEAMRLALGIGFLGAFTTFSTFEFETHALIDDGSWLTATTNMVASLLVGLVAVRVGIVLAKNWLN
jgi:CrcB protein